jgi:hypothetical protein
MRSTTSDFLVLISVFRKKKSSADHVSRCDRTHPTNSKLDWIRLVGRGFGNEEVLGRNLRWSHCSRMKMATINHPIDPLLILRKPLTESAQSRSWQFVYLSH